MRPRRLANAAFLTLSLLGSGALARAQGESRYTKAQTYQGALRYLRVELDCEVVERDEQAAYLMFRYPIPGRKATTHGTIEIVETPKAVRVVVQLPKLPQYHEQVLKDGLMKKLGDDYGEPPAKAPKEDRSPPKKKRDGEESPPPDVTEDAAGE